MADFSDQAVTRRANWVGLRTLRQRPRVVDQTESGEPVFEVRSVRLLLRPDADHFNRLAQCSKCGRNVPGPPVLAPGDLDRPANSVICKECVRGATGSSSGLVPRPAARVQSVPRVDKVETPETAPSTQEVADDGRLSRLESQLHEASTRLEELGDVQRAESLERRRADEAAQASIQNALAGQLAELRAELAASATSVAGRVGALEDNLRRSVAGVAEALSQQREQVGAMSGAIAQTRAELVTIGNGGPVDPRWAEEAERRIAEALRAELQAAISDRVAKATVDAASIQEQVRSNAMAITHMVEVQRTDLQGALDDRLSLELASVNQSLADLAKAQAEIEARLDALADRAQQVEGQVSAVAASVRADTTRLHTLEQKIDESIRRLTELAEARRREVRTAQPSAARKAQAASADVAAGGDLLDSLERQLQEAETRLAEVGANRDRA